jgi:hypothetical protein
MELKSGQMFKATTHGVTLQYQLEMGEKKWQLRALPFEGFETNICESSPSSAVKKFGIFLKSNELIEHKSKHDECDGWLYLKMENAADGNWHAIGSDCWGLSWDGVRGGWTKA